MYKRSMYVWHNIQALITHSYERTKDLLYFGDTKKPSHTGTGLRSQSPRTLESDL